MFDIHVRRGHAAEKGAPLVLLCYKVDTAC
jgi:hypothetical protein